MMQRVLALAAGAMLVPALSSAQGVAIDHKAVECLVVGKQSQLTACLSPAGQVARARVYFRPETTPSWYYVEMRPDAPCYAGVLPKPTKALLKKKVEYYVQGTDRTFTEAQTQTYMAEVVSNAEECKNRPVAPFAQGGGSAVFPSLPAGFAAGGAGIGTTAVLVGVGVAAAGGAVALSNNGDDPTTTTFGVTSTTPATTTPATTVPTTTTTLPSSSTNLPPNAVFRVRPDPPVGLSPLTVTFNMCETTDPENDPLTFRFRFGDGTTDRGGCSRTHIYTVSATGSDLRAMDTFTATTCVNDAFHPEICRDYNVTVNPRATPTPTPKFTLTVTKAGTGTGTVTSSPAGINCGGTCAFDFPKDSTVTLTAAPAAGSVFSGWSGDCTGTGTCVVTMIAAKNVTATFAPACVAISSVAVTSPLAGDVYAEFPFSTEKPFPIPLRASVTPSTATAPVGVFYEIRDSYLGATLRQPTAGTNTSAPTYSESITFAEADATWGFGAGGDCIANLTVLAKASNSCSGTVTSSPLLFQINFCSGLTAGTAPGELATWSSELRVPGGRGQAVLNSRNPAFPAEGRSMAAGTFRRGENRLELQIVEAAGRPGTWRIDLPSESIQPGSLRVVAGEVAEIGPSSVVLRFSGQAGQRALIVFTGR